MEVGKSHAKESLGHVLGKEIAKNILREKGFREHEIMEEFPVIFPTGKKRRIDVVGICPFTNRKIAFEIGILHGGSLEELISYIEFKSK